MKTKRYAILVVGAIALASAACGKKNATEIEGTWTGACGAVGTDYAKTTWEFSGDEFTRTDATYSDSECSEEASTTLREGTFKLGDAVGTPEGAKRIDVTVKKAEITAESEAKTKDFNGRSFCGITDWKEGTARDIFGKNCGGSQVNKDQTFFSIYKFEAEKDGTPSKFTEGDDEQAGAALDSDATRPTRLGTTYTQATSGGFQVKKRVPRL